MRADEIRKLFVRLALAAILVVALAPAVALATNETATSGLASADISSDSPSVGALPTLGEFGVVAGQEDEGAEGELEVETEPGAEAGAEDPEVSTRPYSTLTPVDDPDNYVNTHQLPDSSFLYDTSLDDLASATIMYDGQVVQITGEVIGDILKAGTEGTHVWVTLASTIEDSDATVVVYLPVSWASMIDTLGVYGKTGTILQVRGTYHLACADHEGLSDIHVENVSVLSAGTVTPDTFHLKDFAFGLVGVVIAGALVLVFHMLRQRLR